MRQDEKEGFCVLWFAALWRGGATQFLDRINRIDMIFRITL